MKVSDLLFGASALFVGFGLEHIPMPELLSWFQPLWLLLMVTLAVLQAPALFGLWLALPVGLLVDVEQGTLLGTHVLALTVHIFLLQKVYQRFEGFNLFQQMMVILILGIAHQLLKFWAGRVIMDLPQALDLWGPPLVSAVLWPWLASLAQLVNRRLFT
jgi:rod shape-determining protein MreD